MRIRMMVGLGLECATSLEIISTIFLCLQRFLSVALSCIFSVQFVTPKLISRIRRRKNRSRPPQNEIGMAPKKKKVQGAVPVPEGAAAPNASAGGGPAPTLTVDTLAAVSRPLTSAIEATQVTQTEAFNSPAVGGMGDREIEAARDLEGDHPEPPSPISPLRFDLDPAAAAAAAGGETAEFEGLRGKLTRHLRRALETVRSGVRGALDLVGLGLSSASTAPTSGIDIGDSGPGFPARPLGLRPPLLGLLLLGLVLANVGSGALAAQWALRRSIPQLTARAAAAAHGTVLDALRPVLLEINATVAAHVHGAGAAGRSDASMLPIGSGHSRAPPAEDDHHDRPVLPNWTPAHIIQATAELLGVPAASLRVLDPTTEILSVRTSERALLPGSSQSDQLPRTVGTALFKWLKKLFQSWRGHVRNRGKATADEGDESESDEGSTTRSSLLKPGHPGRISILNLLRVDSDQDGPLTAMPLGSCLPLKWAPLALDRYPHAEPSTSLVKGPWVELRLRGGAAALQGVRAVVLYHPAASPSLRPFIVGTEGERRPRELCVQDACSPMAGPWARNGLYIVPVKQSPSHPDGAQSPAASVSAGPEAHKAIAGLRLTIVRGPGEQLEPRHVCLYRLAVVADATPATTAGSTEPLTVTVPAWQSDGEAPAA